MKKLLKSKLTIFLLALTLLGTQCLIPLNADTAFASKSNSNLTADKNTTKDIGVTVLESNSHHTVVKFQINNFSKDLVTINNKNYYNIGCEGTSTLYNEGAPSLPRICKNIAIPNNSDVKLNILASEYKDYKDLAIAPSKGSITRDQNPDEKPYTFGEEYKNNAFYPSNLASLSEPFLMREIRGTTITLNAFQYKPSANLLRVYKSVTVEIVTDGNSAVNSLTALNSSKITKDFEPAYTNTFINYNEFTSQGNTVRNTPSESGSMLIISYDQYSSAMDSFIQWKTSKGINTTLVNMSTVSSSNSASEIKSYIQNYYNQHPDLAYVLLVGDYAQVSSPAYSDGVSDPTYTLVAGSDNYPDIYVGRFSAESVADVQTQVQRSIAFEQNGYNTADWFKKGVGIASAEGSGESDAQHITNIKTKLQNAGYTQIDSIYDPNASASSVTSSLNAGRGIINYCGHGAETYWVTTGFSNSNIQSLQNVGQLPFILSVSCVSGKFQSGTCFAETWLRSKNSSGNPIGAIGALMSTVNQPWTPPMNGQDGIIDALCSKSKISLGGLCYSGESSMIASGTSDDLLTFYTWTLFGDPSIQILPSSTPPTTNDTYEPNDTIAQAYAANFGTTYSSYIYTATDIDYYKLTTTTAGTIGLSLSNLPGDYNLYLLDSSGTQLAKSENSSTTSEAISYSVSAAGTYYVKVVGNNGAMSTSQAYALTPTFTPTTTDTYEPNDTIDQAYAASFGTTYNSYISTSTDVDYYKLTTTEAGTIALSLSNLAGDYDLYLLNSSGTQLAKSENGSTTSEAISYSASAAGTYYVKVVGYNGAMSTTKAYALAPTFTASGGGPTLDAYEPNNTIAQAYQIVSGTTYKALIGSSTDVDYFKIVVTKSGTVSISLSTLPKDYDLYLVNSSGTVLAKSEKGGTSSESISYNASAGTYYIKVVGYNKAYSTTSQYSLKATFQ